MILLTFLALLLFTFLLALFLTRVPKSERVLHAKLSTIREGFADHMAVSEDPVGHARQRLSDRLGDYVRRFRFSQRLELLILHAGSTITVGAVVLRSFLLAAGIGVAVRIFLGPWPLTLAGAAVGAAVPTLLLQFQRGRRVKSFNNVLPDAIDLMGRALKAGHTVASSIEVVAEQSPEPLASEFHKCFQQQKFGIHFREALLEVGERIPSQDLHFLITAILVQRETGGDLTEILARSSEVIRERIRIQGEIKTYTAQGRLTGWILAAMPVGMLILINIMTPGYTHVLFHDPLGIKLMYAAAGSILVGTAIITKIVDIKV